jgi:hypothetical protein
MEEVDYNRNKSLIRGSRTALSKLPGSPAPPEFVQTKPARRRLGSSKRIDLNQLPRHTTESEELDAAIVKVNQNLLKASSHQTFDSDVSGFLTKNPIMSFFPISFFSII